MLIGLQLYDANAVTVEQQRGAVTALTSLPGIEAVNLQFRDGPHAIDARIETVPVLCGDSVSVTGVTTRRRPLTAELFDRLAVLAHARGHDYFGFINADIVVMPEAIAAVSSGLDTYAISRTDLDPGSGVPCVPNPLTAGLDMFVVASTWWRLHRRRFRPYILGEACWDNVYAAILLCHSNGVLLNREALILHPSQVPLWLEASPAARYNGMLAALDGRYFAMWATYWHRLEAMRACGASLDDEQALRQDLFVWRTSATATIRQFARGARARLRYRQLRAEWEQATGSLA